MISDSFFSIPKVVNPKRENVSACRENQITGAKLPDNGLDNAGTEAAEN